MHETATKRPSGKLTNPGDSQAIARIEEEATRTNSELVQHLGHASMKMLLSFPADLTYTSLDVPIRVAPVEDQAHTRE